MADVSMQGELHVEVQEATGLKHNGHHAVIISFLYESFQSQFIDGYGSWKVFHYPRRFKLTGALSKTWWERQRIHISVIHERIFGDDKIVGECFIPISEARSSEILAWFPLIYKGGIRGSVKVRIWAVNVPSPAASATVPLDPVTRSRLLAMKQKDLKNDVDVISRDQTETYIPTLSYEWPK
jgi:hypothetical protein